MLKNVSESHLAYSIMWFPCDFKSFCKNIMKASLIVPVKIYDGFPFCLIVVDTACRCVNWLCLDH